MELRKGKIISIPLSLIRQLEATSSGFIEPITKKPKVLLLEEFDDVGTICDGQSIRNESGVSEVGGDDDEDVSVV